MDDDIALPQQIEQIIGNKVMCNRNKKKQRTVRHLTFLVITTRLYFHHHTFSLVSQFRFMLTRLEGH